MTQNERPILDGMALASPIKMGYKSYNKGDKMKTLKNNPASFHYHAILKDAVINPTKAYFFNSWQCSSPDECQEYAIAILRKKFDYSDNQIVKLIKRGK